MKFSYRSVDRTNRQETIDEFDRLLLKTIDKTFRYVLGDRNTLIIYDYLGKVCCPIQEAPKKLGLFSTILRKLLGTSRGQIIGVPTVMEDAIVQELSSELGLKLDERSKVFEDRIRRLKEEYYNGQARKKRG